MVEVCQKLSEVQSNFVSCPDKGTKSPAFYSSFIVLHLTQSQGTILISVFYLHLTSILFVSNLHLTSILPDTRAPSPSLYSTFILLLSYLYLTSILLESYPILGHPSLHCILPSSQFYLTCILLPSYFNLTNLRASTPSLYSTFILLLSYLYLISSYLNLNRSKGTTPIIVILPSSTLLLSNLYVVNLSLLNLVFSQP